MNGAVTSSTHPLGTDSYVRNVRGQVTQQTWHDLLSAWFVYDNNSGRLATLNYPDGSLAVYTYDSRGRITGITWKGQTLQTQYDGVGNILLETRSNGISTSVSSDRNSMPIRINHYSSTKTLFDLQCIRNSTGSVTSCSKTGTAGTWSPALTGESTSTQYKYDRSFTIDTRRGQTALTDVSGNQTSIPGPRALSGTYDFQNLLTSWNTNNSNNAVVYDGQNRLIQWTRSGTVRKFHYDSHDRLLFETNTANTITAMWLYRGKQVVAMADSNGVYFYHNDLSANVSFLSDESGEITASYRYLPFGLQTGSVSSVKNPFTFVGSHGVLDLGEGLYYMRSRTYDAVTQAFLSNDPLGTGITANAREYANNNPVNWIDPDGRSGCQSGYSRDGVAEPYQFSNDQVGVPYTKPSYYTKRPDNRDQWSADSMKCATSSLENAVGSMKNGGTVFSAYQVTKKLRQGKYADAAFDAGAMGIGAVNPVAGAMTMFMGASQCGEKDDAAEAALIQKFKDDPNSYYNKHTKKSPSYNDFTIPEFTLDF
jgi:RHS repeat-associated protein